RVFELFRGVTHGAWDPEEHKFHLYTVVIGDQTLHATGYAMGIQRDGAEDEAVIAYFGDGATSQGVVSEAFSWASVFQAPLVFFCQNNQFAISAPPERQSRVPIYQRASGFGFPGIQVDGNDVLACYAVTQRALRTARDGEGPTLIEAFTYRMGAHTTTDDPTRYRLASELETWRLRDPIERVRRYLARNHADAGAFFEQVAVEADDFAVKLRATVLALPDPLPLALFDHVYTGGSAILDAERAQYAAYLASFEEQGAAR
ncbi:MAG TPA: thiamine pyrophosphate-dependent enzyme, partial [Trebonia sp.]